MSKIKIQIIEDDLMYSSMLEFALQELGYLVTSVVDNITDGLESFYSTNPDLVIIDISLEQKYDGIKLAEQINSDQKRAKPFIFLTSSSDNKTFLKAKKTSPSAFLLKPFEKKSLEYAIELAFKKGLDNEHTASIHNSISQIITDFLFIKKDKRILKIPISDVLYIQFDVKRTILYTTTDSYVLKMSLKEILHNLSTEYLVRVHRSFLVNSNKITEIDLEDDKITVCGNDIPIGRNYKKMVVDSLMCLK